RDSHLAHRIADILLLDRAAPAQLVEHSAEAIGQRVEHVSPAPVSPSGPENAKHAGGRNLVSQRPHQPSSEKRRRTKPRQPAYRSMAKSVRMVEPSGIEPLTSCMPCRRSPS